MNPNGAFQEDSDNSGYESDLAIPFQLRQLASDSDDG